MNTMLAFLPNLGMTELLVLAFLGLLIFGKKLPEVGKSLGQGIVSFKKGLQGMESQVDNAVNKPEKKKKKRLIASDAALTVNAGAGEPAATVEKPAE